MAEFNQLLAQQYNRIVKTVLGLDEQEGVNAVSPELAPVFDIAGRIENRALAGEFPWAVRATTAALAANFSATAIRNPSGSETLCVVQGVQNLIAIAGGAFLTGRLQSATSVVATVGTRYTDSRFWAGSPMRATPIVALSLQAVAAAGEVIAVYNAGASEAPVVPFPIVLAPGSELHYWSNTLLLAVEQMWYGYARPARPSELANLGG